MDEKLNVEWDEEKVREIEEFDNYDSGFLNDFGGGQIAWWWDYIRSEVNRANERGKVQYDTLLSLLKKERMERKELEKIILGGILKDHNGCRIYHDEEYTKLESKFYEAEARIKDKAAGTYPTER